MRKPKVYITAPYTADPEAWVPRTIKMANIILRKGGTPFIPHLTHYWKKQSPKDWEEWIVYDSEWLSVCDCVVCMGMNTPSRGRDIELQQARTLKKPIFSEHKVRGKKFSFRLIDN